MLILLLKKAGVLVRFSVLLYGKLAHGSGFWEKVKGKRGGVFEGFIS